MAAAIRPSLTQDVSIMRSSASSARTHGTSILSTAASGLASFIEREGGDPDRVFGIAGTDSAMLDGPVSSMRLEQYCAIFEQAASATGNDNFGLCYGQQFQPEELGMLGYMALASATVGDAFMKVSEMFHHHQQRSMLRLTEQGKWARVEYRIVDPGVASRRQDAELSLGMFVNILRRAHGAGWAPELVMFEHVRPEGARAHEVEFGAPVQFAQPVNALVFPRAVLDQPMPAHDARLLTLMQHNLQHFGLATLQAQTLVERTSHAIRQRLNGHEPTLDEISQALNLPNWTMQRRLRIEGYTYQEVLLRVRKTLALEYLSDPAIQISELAFLLGYSEISAFSRAFNRWQNMPPSEWRRRYMEEKQSPGE